MTKSRHRQSPMDEEEADDLPVMPDVSDEGEEEQDADEVCREGTENPIATDDGDLNWENEDLWDAQDKAIMTDGELGILMHGKARWMGYKGSARKDFFDRMVEELRKLEEMKVLSGGNWERRIKVYGSWLSNHSRKESIHGRLKVGSTWNVRSVVQETHRHEIKQWIKQRNNVKLGSKIAISLHQKELTEYLGDLSDEEIKSAQQLANSWNLKDGPPEDIKAKFADEKGGDLMKEFAREMWRSCGMRMVIITGFKNQKGNVMTAIGDINDTFKDGSKFVKIDKISEEWQEFVMDQLSARGSGEAADGRDSDDASVHPEGGPSRREKIPDAAMGVTRADGVIWVPDITDKTREELQRLVRGYVTAKYRLACGKPKVSAPFKQFPIMFRDMIHDRHLPRGFTFLGDPSHMKVEEARSFLQFIITRQESDPSDTFEFHRWLNDKGELQDVLKSEDEYESGGGMRKQNTGTQLDKRHRQPSRHVTSEKGKAQNHQKGSDDEESKEDSEEDSEPLGRLSRHVASVKGKARHHQNGSDDPESKKDSEEDSESLKKVNKAHDLMNRPQQKSRQRPRPLGRPDEDSEPLPSNQLALTSRQKAALLFVQGSDVTPRPRKGKEKQQRIYRKNSAYALTYGEHRIDEASDAGDRSNQDDEVDSEAGKAILDVRRASKHTRIAIRPRVVDTPQNALYGDGASGERRSTRARKVPKLPRDADFPTPSKKDGHKRKHSGNGKDVGKRLRATQKS